MEMTQAEAFAEEDFKDKLKRMILSVRFFISMVHGKKILISPAVLDKFQLTVIC